MRLIGLLVLAAFLPVIAFASVININTANAVQLDMLPGIGATKAAAIVAYRTQKGSFATIEDIQNVSGIGPITFANIKAFITVGTTTPPKKQPPVTVPSYKKVQAVEPPAVSRVEPIISPTTNIQSHAEAARAPATTTELGAAGAALPLSPQPAPASPAKSIFHSPWTLGLVGIVGLAASVFIFL